MTHLNARRYFCVPDRNAPDVDAVIAPDLERLLDSLQVASAPLGPGRLQRRQPLMDRVHDSALASGRFLTVRGGRSPLDQPAPGITMQTLHVGSSDRLRPGEPLRARLVTMEPGIRWQLPQGWSTSVWRECLVIRGSVTIDGACLPALGFLRQLAVPCSLESVDGALLYLREGCPLPTSPEAVGTVNDAPAVLQHDAPEHWHDFAPGIRRRLMWTNGREAAMAYLASPGALVPHHRHGHDEECLMLQGEVFLDDQLLLEGDYQLAPAGTAHRRVSTDRGGMLFAHGDLDLSVVVDGTP